MSIAATEMCGCHLPPRPADDHALTGTCRHCSQPVELLGGDWTDPDGCTNCMADLSAVYAPHAPKENAR